MEAQYWHQKWEEEKIGFHQAEVNKRLVTFWPQLSVVNENVDEKRKHDHKGCVFVPLCGKSLDMVWLHQQGHRVLGVELSDSAAQAFFRDNHLEFEHRQEDRFVVYSGKGAAEGLTIMVGDFFELRPDQCERCVAFYDRASMIAMPSDMRVRYTRHLATLMPAGTQGLLLTIAYDQSRMQGPPFSVSDENVKSLLHKNFKINELAHYTGPERLGNLKERGLETLDERVYLLQRMVLT